MKYLVLISILFLSGCSSTPKEAADLGITPVMNLIAQTEEQAPSSVKGTFELSIKGAGRQQGVVYLNTEHDYRDRRNISVAIHPNVIKAFTSRYGTSPDEYFIDKTIEVTGKSKRVTIYFISNGKKTDKYYFQTHIRVTSVDQIKVLN